jgi:hypothetical protein
MRFRIIENGGIFMKISIATACLVLLTLATLPSCRHKETWAGSIETKDGVTSVSNPKEPMYSENAVLLEEELAFGGAGADEQAMLGSPFSLVVDDDGNLFILDIKAGDIKKFDTQGKYLMSISRRGQGPGELQGPFRIQMTRDKEIVAHCLASNRLIYFTSEGDYLRETPLIKVPRAIIIMDSRGDLICHAPEPGEKFMDILAKYGPNQERLFQIAAIEALSTEEYFLFNRTIIFNVTRDDHIVWAVTDKYEIMITDPQGRLIKKISRDFVQVLVTQAEKQEMIKNQGPLRPGVKIPDVYPPLQLDYPTFDEAGRIFIKTYEKAADGVSIFFDTFDATGRYVAHIPLKQAGRVPLVWKDDKLYTIEEDESGFYMVKRYKVTWKD